MRIAVGQLWQETNTLNPVPTTRVDFEDFGVLRGARLLEQMAQTNELGGMIQSLGAWREKHEIVGLVRLAAWPSGPTTHEAFEWLSKSLLDAVFTALPVDGLLLALHGAMVAEEEHDVEGNILSALRRAIGPRVPLVATLDLHANVTERMVGAADALVTYHTMPHIDIVQTGERAASVLRRIMFEGARPVTAFQRVPAVPSPDLTNTQSPSSPSWELRERLMAVESSRGILSAGMTTVQPWLDIPNFGSSVLVVGDDNVQECASHCHHLAEQLWRVRHALRGAPTPYADAVRQAHEVQRGLVVLSDPADATTSGAPGDSTWLLSELLKYAWRGPVLVPLVSPEVVSAADRVGAGARWRGEVGGVRDNQFNRPLLVDVTIERLFDARFTMTGHLARNLPIDMGRSAVLRQGNVYIVATSRSGPHFSPQFFLSAGLDPFAAAVVVAKSPCGFRAEYEDRAAKILVVQAPGCAPPDFWNYPYARIERPMWPWDTDFEWSANPQIFRAPISG